MHTGAFPTHLRHFAFTSLAYSGMVCALFAAMTPCTAEQSTPQNSEISHSATLTYGPDTAGLSQEQIADLMMARQRFQAALEVYRQIPHKSAREWNQQGIASQQLMMFDEARRAYQASLKLDEKNSDVLNNLATTYYSEKQYGAAERLYLRALRYNAESAIVWKNLGTAYLAEGNVKKGWTAYQKALRLDPDIFETNSHYHIGDPASASQMGAMNYCMAKSFVMAGNVNKAVEYLRMAIDEGYTDGRRILADRELAVLRDSTAFQLMLAEHRQQHANMRD